ncbi:hypothetical protein CFOL_v3_10726 [Cephalotus follicularis]|uniref:Uncharacterized protein n=1 Tax=Cephalotus follicularis TaxID=3775 RepID=A0A1Q3BH12_CEPFO|nr:hypothetical protein CFOL_v3_10726 [Cephalotus follicularis]
MGLNESYGGIRSQILMMSPLPIVSQAYSLISQEESHRGIMKGAGGRGDVPSMFYSNNFKMKEGGVRCEYCNWTMHKKENCYKLIGYPSGHRLYKGQKGDFPSTNQRSIKGGEPTKKYATHNSMSELSADMNADQPTASLSLMVFTPYQYQQILRLLNKDTTKDEPAEHVANLAGIFTSLMSVYTGDEWIIESGANDHMTANLKCLNSAKPYVSNHASVNCC